MGFLDDLIDGIKQQQNPFTTIRKAGNDLGARPITDAVDGGPGYPIRLPGPVLLEVLILLALPVVIPITVGVAAVAGAAEAASAWFDAFTK